MHSPSINTHNKIFRESIIFKKHQNNNSKLWLCVSVSKSKMRSSLSYRDGIKVDEKQSAIMVSLGQICGEMKEADHEQIAGEMESMLKSLNVITQK